MCEIVGGEERIDPVRERHYGDQFIINLGSEHWKDRERGNRELTGWHTDNDWCVPILRSVLNCPGLRNYDKVSPVP